MQVDISSSLVLLLEPRNSRVVFFEQKAPTEKIFSFGASFF